MKKTTILLLLTIIATTVSSCDDSVPEVNETGYVDFVSFVSTNNNSSTFRFQQKDDEPVITYIAQDLTVDTTFMPGGTRLMLAYVPVSGLPYTDGYIHVLGMQQIYNADVLIQAPGSNWNEDGIYLHEMWRAGSLINLSCRLNYGDAPGQFDLIADPATVNSSNPQLYLVYDYEQQRNNQDKAFYASFDISGVWNKASCHEVTIHLNDTNEGNNSITYKKTETIKPVE